MDRERETRRAGWRLMRGTLGSQRAWLVLGVLSGFSWTAAKIAVPLLAAGAIDNGILPGNSQAILVYSLVIVGVGVVQGLSSGFRRFCAFRIAYRSETDLRQRLFAHLQRLHFAFHDEAQTGQLMARANTDIFQINQAVILIPLTIASSLTLVGVVTVMALQSVPLTLLALGALPLLNISATRFSKRMQPVTTQLQAKLGDLTAVVEENVAGVRAVKGFGSERLQERQLDHEADEVRDRSLESARLRSGFLPLVDFLPALALVAILWYGGHLVLNGELQLGYIVAFNSYVLMLIWPLRMAGMLVAQASRASAAAGRLDAILVTDPEVVDKPGARALPPGPGEIRFENVAFGYQGGRPIFTNLDLLIRQDDGHPARPALLRRRRRPCAARRHGRARRQDPRPAPQHRHRLRGHVPLLGHRARQHRLRRSAGADGDRAWRGAARGRRRVHRRHARRVRDDRRRVRLHAVGRTAPAARHRAGGARRPARADPRRRHLVGRPDQGARDPRRAARGHGRTDHVDHRPPAGDHRPRRPGRPPRRRARGRRRHP